MVDVAVDDVCFCVVFVRIGEDWRYVVGWWCHGVVSLERFEVFVEVLVVVVIFFDDVDFFVGVLFDVVVPQVVCFVIKGILEGVAEAVGLDFVLVCIYEVRVAGCGLVFVRAVDIDLEDGRRFVCVVLGFGVVVGCCGIIGVVYGDVQYVVGVEADPVVVVVCEVEVWERDVDDGDE